MQPDAVLKVLRETADVIRRPDQLLDDIERFVRRFVIVDDDQAAAIVLFVAHTHAVDACDTTPYLGFVSAERRSGKTRGLEVVELLVANPLRTSASSEAALFRTIEEDRPTLLLDEADAIFGPKAREHEGLRSLLNAGFRRGSPILRCVGEGSKMRMQKFDPFCAKILAGIGDLPDTVADRALLIRMKRRAVTESVEKFRRRRAEAQAEPLRAALEEWMLGCESRLTTAEPSLPDELDDRGQDAVEILLAIADEAGGEWPVRARRAVVKLRADAADVDNDSLGVRLLSDVRALFDKTGVEKMSTQSLIAGLAEDEEAPWATLHGSGLHARGLSRLLKPYGVHSRSIRLDDGTTPKGFARVWFEDAFARYVPESATSATTAETSGKERVSNPPQIGLRGGYENGAKPHGYAVVADVADKTSFQGSA